MLTEIMAYIKSCSAFREVKVGQELLEEQAGDVCLRSLGERPLLQRYADGSSLNQFVFMVCVRDDAFLQKAGGRKKLEELAACLEEGKCLQERLTLTDGCFPQSFEVLETAAVVGNSFSSVRYEMKCRLIYYREEV